MPLARLCPACGELFQPPALCPSGCIRPDGRVVTAHRLALEKVYDSPRWKRLSRCIRARDGACVDCGATDDLTADHIEGFLAETDPKAWDESNIVTRCRSCHGRRDGGVRL